MSRTWHIRFLFTIGILFASASSSWAQQKSEIRLRSLPERERIDATLLTEADGLSNSSATDMLQDSKGFLWIATAEGLNRYDGKEFVTFYHDQADPGTLSGSGIDFLHEDPDGHIWGVSGGVVNELDPVTGLVVRHELGKPGGLPGRPTISGFGERFFTSSDSSLWVFTEEGLARRKKGSKDFKIFKRDTTNVASLARDNIKSVIEGPTGYLWVLTSGVYLTQIRLSDDRVTRFSHLVSQQDSLGGNYYVSTWSAGSPKISWFVDQEDRFWVGVDDRTHMEGRIFRYDEKSDQFVSYTVGALEANPGSSFVGKPLDFMVFPDGAMGVATHAGLLIYDADGDRFDLQRFPYPEGKTIVGWFSPIIEPDGSILFSLGMRDVANETGGVHLAHYDLSTKEFSILDPDPRNEYRPNRPSTATYNNSVNSVDPAGFAWLREFGGGMTRYDTKTKTFKDLDERDGAAFSRGLKSTSDLLTDRTGEFWMFQPQVGLIRMSMQDQPLGLLSAAIPGDPMHFTPRVIHSMFLDQKGTFWVGSEQGLHRWNADQSQFETFSDTYRSQINIGGILQVHHFYEREDGTFVLGTSTGLYLFDPSNPAFKRFALNGFEDAQYRTVRDLLPRDNNTFVLATPQGIYVLDDSGSELTQFDEIYQGDVLLEDHSPTTLIKTRDGHIWAGLSDGLARVDLDAAKMTRLPDSVYKGYHPSQISVILEDPSDPVILWVGTQGAGFFKFDQSQGLLAYFTVSNSDLPNNIVESMLFDDEGMLWLATNKGLTRFDPQEEVFRSFGLDDGLQSLNFVEGASLKAPDGTLMFGGTNGINFVEPGALTEDATTPVIAMSRMIIYNASTDSSRQYYGEDQSNKAQTHLTYQENDLTFSFAALHFTSPADNQYSYRLEGYEPSFSKPSTTNTVRYSNLASGDYTFRVEASNSDGIWTKDGYAFSFTILPPWWATIWAYLGYAFLLGVTVWRFDRFQRSRIEKKEREAAKLKRAELEAKASAAEAAALKSDNERKEIELEKSRELEYAFSALQTAHNDLKSTQDQLIHAEKMASLGALTAGIAHEIKNPLNFINNFAEINQELATDILDALPPSSEVDEVRSMLTDLKQNSDVIGRHGKRADSIVQSMLMHARTGAGEKELVDINKALGEYIDLAYHGKRSRFNTFKADISRQFGASTGSAYIIPQDMGRVFLNVLSNAFDAVAEQAEKDPVFKPHITVMSLGSEDAVEIRISDNGPGIEPSNVEEIFKPFFTTKPTGSGTGLGLSMSYDTVTKAHGGQFTVESEKGQGATFIIQIPR